MDEGEGLKEKRGTVSVLNGPAPEVLGFASATKEAAGVADQLRTLLSSGYAPRETRSSSRSGTCSTSPAPGPGSG
jgi:hypothetical protein